MLAVIYTLFLNKHQRYKYRHGLLKGEETSWRTFTAIEKYYHLPCANCKIGPSTK